jgi:hypothetical protein
MGVCLGRAVGGAGRVGSTPPPEQPSVSTDRDRIAVTSGLQSKNSSSRRRSSAHRCNASWVTKIRPSRTRHPQQPRAGRTRSAHPSRHSAPSRPLPVDQQVGTAGTERDLQIRALSATGPVAGGQLPTRARSPLSKNCLPIRVPRGPQFRTVRPYADRKGRANRRTREPSRYFIPNTDLPRVFRTVDLCYFMLRVARLDNQCGPGAESGSPMLSGVAADYRRFQYSRQYLAWLCWLFGFEHG